MLHSTNILDLIASNALVGAIGGALFALHRLFFRSRRKVKRQVLPQEPRLFRDADDFNVIEWTEDRRVEHAKHQDTRRPGEGRFGPYR